LEEEEKEQGYKGNFEFLILIFELRTKGKGTRFKKQSKNNFELSGKVGGRENSLARTTRHL